MRSMPHYHWKIATVMGHDVMAIETSETTRKAVADGLVSGISEAVQGFTLVNALFAFLDCGLYEEWRRRKVIDLRSAPSFGAYNESQMIGLLRYLTTQGILVADEENA